MIELYKNALKIWGAEVQIGVFHEEVGELLQAINKYRRHPSNVNKKLLEQEIADVYIMIEQLILIFDLDEGSIGSFKESKLRRLSDRLNTKAEKKS